VDVGEWSIQQIQCLQGTEAVRVELENVDDDEDNDDETPFVQVRVQRSTHGGRWNNHEDISLPNEKKHQEYPKGYNPWCYEGIGHHESVTKSNGLY
jgi:hypothetical protein